MDQATGDEQASKRAAKRDSLLLMTTIKREGGATSARARIRNLSETGLMADCDMTFSDGERVVVDLRGIGAVPGTVSWVRSDRIGMVFDSSIDPQLARKSVQGGIDATMPTYLRPIGSTRFMR